MVDMSLASRRVVKDLQDVPDVMMYTSSSIIAELLRVDKYAELLLRPQKTSCNLWGASGRLYHLKPCLMEDDEA